MNKNEKLAYSEVYAILELLENEYADKVPDKIKEFFYKEKDKEYNPKIDVKIPLEQQNLKRETMIILAILNLNYWCDSEDEKNEIKAELIKNNEIKEKELVKIYNPDNLFNGRAQKSIEKSSKNQNMQLVEYKSDRFIKKILQKIMSFFRK